LDAVTLVSMLSFAPLWGRVDFSEPPGGFLMVLDLLPFCGLIDGGLFC
jgi:hypothetical protein